LQSDSELVKACKKGLPEAQRLLYGRYAPLMKAICMRYIQDRALVSDVLQDSFVKVFKNLKNFKEEGSLEGWLRRIVVNTSLDQLRKLKLINTSPIIADFEETSEELLESEDDIIEQIHAAGFTKELLLDILLQLPKNYAAAFNMFYIDEINHKDIALALEINEGMSRKWAFRAKDMVRKYLIKYLEDKVKKVY
jgi:RNA polymerase sigma factor (sigma-70 family)